MLFTLKLKILIDVDILNIGLETKADNSQLEIKIWYHVKYAVTQKNVTHKNVFKLLVGILDFLVIVLKLNV